MRGLEAPPRRCQVEVYSRLDENSNGWSLVPTQELRHAVGRRSLVQRVQVQIGNLVMLAKAGIQRCSPRIFNTLTIREDGACFICRYPLHANIHDKLKCL